MDYGDPSFEGTNHFDFGDALRLLYGGFKVTRDGWNGWGMWIKLQVPYNHSKMTLPYIYMSTEDKRLVPWIASQSDILAHDWMLVAE